MDGGRTRKRAAALIGGALFALFASFGWQMEHDGASRPLRALFVAALLTLPAAALLTALYEGAWRRLLPRRTGTPRVPRPYRTGQAALLLFACYVPMFLIACPGSFAYDVPFQLRQVFTGAYSTHHPLIHTLLLGGCVALGRALGSIDLGAALYTLVQMALLSACFALTCASIVRRCGARAARRSLAFFALYPLHMLFAVNATKDVLFGGCFALTLALALELAQTQPEHADGRLVAGLAAVGALMMLLRNNAVYAAAVWLLALIPAGLRRRGLLRGALLAIALSLAVNSALTAATGAVRGDLSEMLSWPIQQLARARLTQSENLTQEECAEIDALMPGEAWREYDPTISDPVKFAFDTERMKADPGGFLRLYVRVGLKCPKAYLDAVLALTLPFYYPYSRYMTSGYYLQMGISTEQTGQWCGFDWIASRSLFPRALASLSWRFGAQGAMQIPVVGWLFNTGVIVWVMLALVLREAYFGRWRRFAVALLPVLLWGTYLLGPVMAGRYAYPFVCALPVLAAGSGFEEKGVPERAHEDRENHQEG